MWSSRSYRPLLWAFGLLEAFFLTTGGKAYYPAPMLILFAAAGVAAKQTVAPAGDAARRTDRRRMLMPYTAIAAFGALLLPAVLPVLLEAVFASSPYAGEDDARAAIGWPQLAQQVDAVIELAVVDRAHTVLLTRTYGEAGALEHFGHSDLPVYNGHNSLWYYGRPSEGASGVVTIGYDTPALAAWFATCRIVANVHTPRSGQPGKRRTHRDLYPAPSTLGPAVAPNTAQRVTVSEDQQPPSSGSTALDRPDL